MKKTLSFLIIGIAFGIIMFKSQAASWFRIFEMFHFQSFHMYGIIGSALILGLIGVQIIKRKNVKSFSGDKISLLPKKKGFSRYMYGGIVFGLGWALVGACPGPIYVLIGAGFFPVLVVLIGALLGTFIYGLLREKLPH